MFSLRTLRQGEGFVLLLRSKGVGAVGEQRKAEKTQGGREDTEMADTLHWVVSPASSPPNLQFRHSFSLSILFTHGARQFFVVWAVASLASTL